jgi:hypothetical protein
LAGGESEGGGSILSYCRQPAGFITQAVARKIDKGPCLGGCPAAFVMNQLDRNLALFKVPEDFHQPAVGKRVGNLVGQRPG